MVLLSKAIDAWVHIHLLPRVEFCQKIRCHRQIMPRQIKHRRQLLIELAIPYRTIMILLKVLQLPIADLSRNFLDNVILGLADIYHETMLWVLLWKWLVTCIIPYLFFICNRVFLCRFGLFLFRQLNTAVNFNWYDRMCEDQARPVILIKSNFRLTILIIVVIAADIVGVIFRNAGLFIPAVRGSFRKICYKVDFVVDITV